MFTTAGFSGRVGPGAGGPAKVYSVSSRSFSVEIPQTRYGLAASMMATALSAHGPGADGAGSLEDVATAFGESLGSEIRRQARTKGARLEAVQRKLGQLGYEPRVQESGEWTMRNCIFAELSTSHRGARVPDERRAHDRPARRRAPAVAARRAAEGTAGLLCPARPQ